MALSAKEHIFGQGSSKVSESFGNFKLRISLVFSTFPEDCRW